jgi:signal transduction histidine kinase
VHAQREDLMHISGVGLGLSIVDDCVHAMGGRVQVESEEGIGTTFVMRLPVGSVESTPG